MFQREPPSPSSDAFQYWEASLGTRLKDHRSSPQTNLKPQRKNDFLTCIIMLCKHFIGISATSLNIRWALVAQLKSLILHSLAEASGGGGATIGLEYSPNEWFAKTGVDHRGLNDPPPPHNTF